MRRVLTATLIGLMVLLGGGRGVLLVAADDGDGRVCDPPTQSPISFPISLIFIAGSLLFIPSIGDSSSNAGPPSQSDFPADGLERGSCW